MQQEFLSKLNSLGKQIKELRKHSGKTQSEVACAIGITPQSYQAYEAGKALPTLENFMRLCDFFDVSPDVLLDVRDY